MNPKTSVWVDPTYDDGKANVEVIVKVKNPDVAKAIVEEVERYNTFGDDTSVWYDGESDEVIVSIITNRTKRDIEVAAMIGHDLLRFATTSVAIDDVTAMGFIEWVIA